MWYISEASENNGHLIETSPWIEYLNLMVRIKFFNLFLFSSKKNRNIYWSKWRFTGLGPEDLCSSWGLWNILSHSSVSSGVHFSSTLYTHNKRIFLERENFDWSMATGILIQYVIGTGILILYTKLVCYIYCYKWVKRCVDIYNLWNLLPF